MSNCARDVSSWTLFADAVFTHLKFLWSVLSKSSRLATLTILSTSLIASGASSVTAAPGNLAPAKVSPGATASTAFGVSGKEKAASAGELRTIVFPPDLSLGAVFIGKRHSDMDERGLMNQVGGAKGTLKVLVPPGHYVLLEANRRVFQNPELLRKVSPVGIDYLKIGMMSMDDSEEKLCNAALPFVDHFPELSQLQVDRSDTTDSGLAVVKKLKHLKAVSAFQTSIDGSFLQYLVDSPEMTQLNISCNSLKFSNLKYVPALTHLEFINLSRTGLDIEGVKELVKSQSLRHLRLGQNAKFNDQCLKLVATMKNVQVLDLRDTPITMQGLRSIKNLKLKGLQLSARLTTPTNMNELKSLFPAVPVAIESHAIPEDVKSIYAPLK